MVLNLDEEKLSKDNQDSVLEVPNERGGGLRTISRLNFLRFGILGGFTILGWRLWDLQKPLQDTSFNNPTKSKTPVAESRFITSKPPRGIIYDRNGKRLVLNQATYRVTITANYLPDRAKGQTDEEKNALDRQRQEVYDNLARFLGMNYFLCIVPEQVNGIRKKGSTQFSNPKRNAILNELEVITGTSAQDWDKLLIKMADEGKDKDLFVVNEKDPFPIEQFDRYKYLRDKFDDSVLFLSEAEKKMFEARSYIPAYQPIEVWSNLIREDAILLTEKRLDYPGVDVQISYIRQYEDPRLYGHILGYTGRFRSQEQMDRANKEASADYSSLVDPDDPSAKINAYDIDDKIGLTGVEGWMEPFLRGRKGATEVLVDSLGHILQTVKIGRQSQPGSTVILSIDTPLQAAVANSLEKWINEANRSKNSRVKEGAAVVMDVNTGEVLALVAFPWYDNNLYNKPANKWTEAETKEISDPEKAVQVNRAVSARYAPGSTFKLITAAAALNEKKISRFTTFSCPKYIEIPTTQNPKPSQTFRCWWNHGPLDIVGAIENSCDVFFYNAAVPDETNDFYGRSRYYNRGSTVPNYFRGLGINLLNGYMALFNLGKPTGIELPEYPGTLAGPQYKLDTNRGAWSIGDTMTTAIGQGDLEITPLQMCMITACIANGGKLLQPKLVRQVKDADGKDIIPFEPKLIRDVTKNAVKWLIPDAKDSNKKVETEFRLEPAVLQVVREGMLAVTGARGTAASQMYNKLGKLKVAGKTGTAEYGEVIGKDTDGNETRATRAWFTAYAPYDNPQIAVTVMISSGDAALEGSTFAVPAVREIFEYKFPDLVKPKP